MNGGLSESDDPRCSHCGRGNPHESWTGGRMCIESEQVREDWLAACALMGSDVCSRCYYERTGKARIRELEATNVKMAEKLVWFEKLMKPSLLTRVFRRFFARRSYTECLEDGLKTILSHAGSAIECVDEPGAGYLRDVCEIVDQTFGIDTSREEEEEWESQGTAEDHGESEGVR